MQLNACKIMGARASNCWLATAKPQLEAYAERRLGGVTLYSSTEECLDLRIRDVHDAIVSTSREHILLIRQVLRSEAQKQLDFELSDRVFGAVLGRMLKLGEMKVLLALSINLKVLRILFHETNHDTITSILDAAKHELLRSHRITTKEVQARHFAGRWAGYYMAQQVCGALVYLGVATQPDRDLYELTTELIRALC